MKKELEWRVSRFEELTVTELYDILHIRSKVFIMEQNAPYQDADYKDQKAIHLHGYIDGTLVAYCRIFKAGDYFDMASIGRVIVVQEYRKYGYGHDMMERAIELERSIFGETCIRLSAQLYLQKFYESHSFVRIGDVYQEDGLPHIRMERI